MNPLMQGVLYLVVGFLLLRVAQRGVRLGLMPGWSYSFNRAGEYSRGIQPLGFWGMGLIYACGGAWLLMQAYGLMAG